MQQAERTLTIKMHDGRWEYKLFDDGYRVYAQKVSKNPANDSGEPKVLFEYKHSDVLVADELIHTLLHMAGAVEVLYIPPAPRFELPPEFEAGLDHE
jgi:hypothetical protein